jgi:tetratricopeptide (TPR) repeat protein
MKIFTRKRLWMTALFLIVLAGLAGATRALWPAKEGDSYPNCPFEKVGADFPRIIPVKEDLSREERDGISKYLQEGGAVSRAMPEEREAVAAVLNKKYVRAWELGRQIVRANRQSIPGRYVVADVFFHADGRLPRALFHIRKARRLLEERGRANPRDADSREWYIRALHLEYEILSHMDRPELQIRVVELLGQVYDDLPWLKVWPLMKLKRFDEAHRCIDQLDRTGRWKRSALLYRNAVEAEAQRRRAALQTGERMVQTFADDPVLWSNFAESAFGAFRLEQAEGAYRRAAQLSSRYTWSSGFGPYRSLAGVYLQQGRLQEAFVALKKAKRQRDQREPYTLDLDQGRSDRSCALFLLTVGRAEEALRFARRANDRPDRTGFTSTDEARDTLTNKLVLWTVLQSRLEQLREEDPTATGLAGLAPDGDRRALEFEAWALKKQLQKLLGGLSRRNDFRPYLPGNAEIESWLTGSLVQVLPPAAATVAIRQARAADREFPEAAAYCDAFEAEAALCRGQPAEALDLAQKALARLPAWHERLLRARTAAVAAETARRLGQDGLSRKLLDQVLADSPQALRLIRVALPVRVQHDGSPLARRVAECLLRSPRFREDPAGFPVVINTRGGKVVLELSRLGGGRHFQEAVPAAGEEEEVVKAAVKGFHQKLMSPTLTLTAADINLVDGAAAGARQGHELNKLLNN